MVHEDVMAGCWNGNLNSIDVPLHNMVYLRLKVVHHQWLSTSTMIISTNFSK